LQDSSQNKPHRQGQEKVPDRERIIEKVGVQAMRRGVSKTYLRILFRSIGVIVLVDSMGRIVVVAMVVRVGMCMTMGGRIVRMRRRRLMG
jgi:hypothetical protein